MGRGRKSKARTGKPYLAHTVKYNGNPITAGAVNDGTVIAPNNADTYTIRVEYIQPENEADLPTTAVNETYSVTLTYTQAA